MATRSRTVSGADAARVRRKFERWRDRRSPGTRIPDELWADAVNLVPEFGVSATARLLRLDYYAVQKRSMATVTRPARDAAARAAGAGGATAATDGGPVRFVEVPQYRSAVSEAGGACVLEVEDGERLRVRMDVRGMGASELGQLVRRVMGVAD